jgi:trk system potassium uptake protein TrkA
VPEGYVEAWRDPTGVVAIVEVPVHSGWVGNSVHALEQACGARVAYLMRFGLGTLPTASTLLQDGDQVYVLATDNMVAPVSKITGSAPEGGH